MHYRIFGTPMPAVTLTLDRGEEIYTQSGGMTWMSEGFSMETNMKGGLLGGIGRMFAGEKLPNLTIIVAFIHYIWNPSMEVIPWHPVFPERSGCWR